MFLPPPPSWFIFLPQLKFDMRGCAPQAKNFLAFFVLFCKFLVNWGKNMHTFYQLGKKYAFPPFFHSLSIIFFPLHVICPYFCPTIGGSNRKIYTPEVRSKFLWLGFGCVCFMSGSFSHICSLANIKYVYLLGNTCNALKLLCCTYVHNTNTYIFYAM